MIGTKMRLNSLPRAHNANQVQAKLDRLYARRSLLSDVIHNLEKYQAWIARGATHEQAPRFRCRRAA